MWQPYIEHPLKNKNSQLLYYVFLERKKEIETKQEWIMTRKLQIELYDCKYRPEICGNCTSTFEWVVTSCVTKSIAKRKKRVWEGEKVER